MKGADAVISELGVKIGSSEPVLSVGNKNIVSAMQKLNIKRLITQSAFGAADSWQSLPFYYKLIHKTLLGPMSLDKDKMEKIVASSGLDYTIIRPIRLTSGPAKGHYRAGESIKFGLDPHISRKDVARFIIDELKAKHYIRQAITLTY
jgi:putative NADH-flavin reductase